uniref:RNA-dependent RNA polymerase n=1 Tax=Cnidium polerovirus 1 TaxID=3019006 RepID=A0AA51ZUL0_9VIRU|nr:MAG: RNA-dependent RNA polymerase [Cnidium polerovirus 1]
MGSMGLIMPQILFFFLLCTFCYPSIATDNFILKLDGLSSRNASYEAFSTGVSTPATLPIFSFEEIGLSYILPPPPPQALTETSYGDLSMILWEKISSDFLRFCSGAWMFLVLCYKATESFTIEWSFYLTGLILDLVAFIWWKILCALFNGLYKLITNFAMQFLTICILAAVTAIIWKGLRWICGNLPMFLLTFPLKIIWKVLWCRPSSPREFKNEKAVDGYISIPITMSPPSNSIVEIIYEGSEAHAGYATCVKLHNGYNGLLTSSHIFTSNGKYAVRSLRESSKGATIGIKDFVVKYQSDHHDITIFTGPPSWESRLGCGAANIMTADRITRGEVCYYTHSFGKWRRYNAKLTGNYFNLVTVLSNTEAGDSGSAYWYGKSVLGVHKGCTLDERDNFNLMAPIPNIPGLTSSKLVFETSAPQGKIFDDWAKIQEEYEELLEDLSGTEAISVMKKRRPELFRDELKSLVVALKGEFTPVDALIANNFMEKCAEIINTDHERVELNYIPNWEFSDEAKPPPTMKTDVDYIRRELEVMHAVNKKQQDLADKFMRQNLDLMKAMKTPPAPFVHEAKPEVSGKRTARRRPRNNRKHPKQIQRDYLRHCGPCQSDCGNHSIAFPCKKEGVFKRNARNKLIPVDGCPYWEQHDCCGCAEIDSLASSLPAQHERATNENSGDCCKPAEETAPKQTREEWRKQEANEITSYFASLYKWGLSTPTCEVSWFRHVGNLPQFYHSKQKTTSEWGKGLIELYPELAEKTKGFGWPEFGAKAELKSLQLQASRWQQRALSAKIPSDAQRRRVIAKTAVEYSSCRSQNPNFCNGSSLEWRSFIEDFKAAVSSLELDAGVGVPLVALKRKTHRSWVEGTKNEESLLPQLAQLTFDRLQKLSEVSFEALKPEELVQQGLCDPIRLFVKGEPHKQSKLDEGRYRLIMSVSLIDQLVARVLFQAQNKLEIALWRAVPSKPGFGLSTDEQIVDFVECLAKQAGLTPEEVTTSWEAHLYPTDCSGFDWSVSQWMLEDDMQVRNELTINCTPLTRKLRAAWLHCIGNSVLCLSDGTLLAQTHPGVQKSGSYNTSSSNSRIRVMAAYHCGASWAMAMGDDALESKDSSLELYKDLGFKVEVSGQLEFCSHIFEKPDLAIPVNISKMLYKLIHGYEPGCGNFEVMLNYISAVASVLNELRYDPELVSKLRVWLLPVESQKKSS